MPGENSRIDAFIVEDTFYPFSHSRGGDRLVRLGIADKEFGVARGAQSLRTRHVLL